MTIATKQYPLGVYKRPKVKGFYTLGEVAKILGVFHNSIRRAERMGRIPKASREQVSNERYYTEADVSALRAHFAKTKGDATI